MKVPSDDLAPDDIRSGGPTPATNLQNAMTVGSGIENSLVSLNEARSILSPEKDAQEWARLTVEMGDMYYRRRVGGVPQNLELAVKCYDEALTVLQWKKHPTNLTICHGKLGRAYLDMSDGQDHLLKELSLVNYKMALSFISKEGWPEMWHRIHLELSMLFQKYATFSDDENARLSDEHYRMAFDLDRDKEPELYNMLIRMHELYSRLLGLQLELRRARARREDQ